MSKKVVIVGSLSFQKEIDNWIQYWTNKGYTVTNYPKPSADGKFPKNYPKIKRNFYKDLSEADILFVVNEDKNGVSGYIGAQVFAEMVFAVTQNLIYNKKIRIILAKKPSKEVQSLEEIKHWLGLGWVNLLKEDKL